MEAESDLQCCESHQKHNSWKPFLRQLLISSGVCTTFFMQGLCTGSPTVLIPQLRREANNTDIISDEMASWISSAIGLSGIPCVIIVSIMASALGRKISLLIACIDSFLAFIVFITGVNIAQILSSLIMQGLFSASQSVIALLIITEYTSPKYRGTFLMLKAATFYWGIWMSNFVGTFFSWQKIGFVGLACSVYSIGTILIWPKSPYWLASKGRFRECANNYRWLRGRDDESEKELDNLINTQKEYLKTCSRDLSVWEKIKEFYHIVMSVSFYKPVLISVSTGMLTIASGKLVCAVYALEIIKKITKSESKAYVGMLVLDGVTVFAMYLGCSLSRIFKRRTLLFVSSSLCVSALFFMSLYLYLIKLSVIIENTYITLGLLSLFSISVSCGPLLMSISTYAELIPVRSRNIAICLIALIGKFCVGVSLKVSPFVFKNCGLHGTFLFFGVSMLVVLLILYKYLPETKDKTLQEIVDSMKSVQKGGFSETKSFVSNS